MKFNNIILASCALFGTLAFTSCVKYDGLIDAEYHRVLNIKDAGVRSIELYTTNPEGNIPITIMKTGSEKSITADALLSSMSQEAFTEYCKVNDLHYSLIPSEYYTLNNNDMQFGADERYKFVEVVIKTRELKGLMDKNPENQYALPLLLSSIDATVNDSLLIVLPDVMAPTLGFTSSGYNAVAEFSPSGESIVKTSVQLEMPVKDEWGLQCTLSPDETAKAAFDSYNAQNGNRYTMLPKDGYTMDANGVITFEKGSTTASMNITFDKSKISAGEYILPLSISNVSNDGFVIDGSNNVVLLGVLYSPEKIELKVDQFYANSILPSDGAGYNGLIDGLGVGKHFHSIYPGGGNVVVDPTYGNYIDVNLKSPLKSVKFDYWTRFDNSSQGPTHIKIFVSNEVNVWTELDDIRQGLPGGQNEKYSSKIYVSETSFKKFRFAVLQSKAGDMTAGGSGFFSLGELTLYGN